MELEKEFRLVQSLSTAEKRQVRLIGNSMAGSGGSQVMDLFDRFNRLSKFDQAQKQKLFRQFGRTLPTVSSRLYTVIIKCLQYGLGSKTLVSKLDLMLFEAQQLEERGMIDTAESVAFKGYELASAYGVWHRVPAFLSLSRRLLMRSFPPDITVQLDKLEQQEKQAVLYIRWQQELEHYRSLLIAARRLNVLRKNNEFRKTISRIEAHPALAAEVEFQDFYLESLSLDLRGLLLLTERKGSKALQVYRKLLHRWCTAGDWINQYSDFYISAFTNYQLAVFWGTVSTSDIRSYLSLLPETESMSERHRLDFERIRYGHLITIGLNTGQFALVLREIPQIEAWLQLHKKQIAISSQLAFRYNICITYFLAGRYREAYRVLQPILQHRGKGSREDILDFSRVLQAVLLFQLEEVELGEYMVRSARQFFRRNPRQWDFEQAVLRYLRLSITARRPQQETLRRELIQSLDLMAKQNSGAYPLLGLTEIRCWLESRMSGKSITEIFGEKMVKQKP